MELQIGMCLFGSSAVLNVKRALMAQNRHDEGEHNIFLTKCGETQINLMVITVVRANQFGPDGADLRRGA